MIDVDAFQNPYQCAVCDERFSEKSAREKHYFKHAKLVKRCRVCGRFCMNSEQCNPKKRKVLKCQECTISTTSKTKALEHNNNKNLEDVVELNDNQIVKPVHKPKNICEVCDKSFSSKRGLQIHLNIHLNIKPYTCPVCDKAFRTKPVLQDHLLTHSNVKAFVCEFCNRPFRTKKGLKKHYLTHTQEKPYMCEICGRCFSAKGNLKIHYRIHNKIKKESIIL